MQAAFCRPHLTLQNLKQFLGASSCFLPKESTPIFCILLEDILCHLQEVFFGHSSVPLSLYLLPA